MALQRPPTSLQDWVADFGTSHHTTPSADNISKPRPLNSSSTSSIVVGNGSSLSITSVVDSVHPGLFYFNNILLAPDIVQSLLFVCCFTTNNWCSMEIDPFCLSVKDLTTQNMIVKSNSIGPLYTMSLPWALQLLLLLWLQPPGTIVLVILALTPYLAFLGNLLLIVPAINMICVMHASWENTSGCLFLVHQIVRLRPLI
jgi:hypothetical protein